MNLKNAVKSFLEDNCKELRYSMETAEREESTGKFEGRSLKTGQIPYNMQMDIDRKCFTLALERFLDSGTARDAFDVYFCFIEMFLTGYEKTSAMIELLSEYESNTSNVVMKHRDHYSHSVYVFALGLAVYGTNEDYRMIYEGFYNLSDTRAAAHHFLKYWGITSLFHDIGYPFELPFEQVEAYFESNRQKRAGKPFIAYRGLDEYKRLSEYSKKKIATVYGGKDAIFENTDEFFAYAISQRLADTYVFSEKYMKQTLSDKPEHPEKFSYFMDHAYFSALILFKKLYEELELDISMADIDVLSAILIHNSLYKFNIAYYKDDKLNKPFDAGLHPLAYMLMLCDELQCWDRTAYGRTTRSKLYPMDCDFDFQSEGINICFLYDEKESSKADSISEMRAAPGEKCRFHQELDTIVDTSMLRLKISAEFAPYRRSRKRTYLSDSDFLHLYYFAVALNGRYGGTEDCEQAFKELSLEYKLSNINQAKSFDVYLNKIGAFYTDRPVDFPELEDFTSEELELIGRLEHDRWCEEHRDMGWTYGLAKDKDERELKRIHKDMVPYEELDETDREKDRFPMLEMLKLLRKYDGVRIYRLE